MLELADSVVLLSHEDGRALQDMAARSSVARRSTVLTIPPPVTRRTGTVRLFPPLRFVFVGSDTFTQNRLTIEYLLTLWRRYRPPTDLHIFGQQSRPIEPPAGVHMRGYVERLDEIYDQHSILLTPSFLGGGIKTKVLEAFSYGTPVVGNDLTFESMGLQNYPFRITREDDLVRLIVDPVSRIDGLAVAADVGARYVVRSHDPATFERCWHQALGLSLAESRPPET